MTFYLSPGYKLKNKGTMFLDDAELLSIIFGDEDVTSASMLLAFYNLHEFSGCSQRELKSIIKKENKVKKIMALSELFLRHSKLEKRAFRKNITTAEDVYEIMVDELRDKKKEFFYALLLDNNNSLIKKNLVSVGTLNASLIHPREVFKEAIKESANSLILVHNHPSGNIGPSEEDKKITETLVEAGEILGIKVLDHVIVGDGWKSLL